MPADSFPFRSIGSRLVRVVAACCAVAAMAVQTLYAVKKARDAFAGSVREISATRVPILASALWDIDTRLAQAQIDDIARLPQIAGVRLDTAAGITLQAGRAPLPAAADVGVDIMPAAGSSMALGRLSLSFDHGYVVRQAAFDSVLAATFIALFTVVLCVLLIRFLRAGISVPLQRLLRHVNSLSPDALAATFSPLRAKRPWRDELDQLADGFASLHGGIARYVGERNRAEAELAQERDQLEAKVTERTRDLAAARDKADQASRSKSEFLANMSHEIRTPINAITGFTTLALRTRLDTQQTGYLERIQAAAQGLLRIVNDLLDFSKIEAGHLDMECIAFRLAEVMDTVVAYVVPLAERKGLELLLRIDADVPAQVLGDPLRLDRC